jgi:hypothetical protein
MSITHLVAAKPAFAILIDQSASAESVINYTTNGFSVITRNAECAQPAGFASKHHACER